MKNAAYVVVVTALSFSLSGCFGRPYLYGNDSCGPGKTPYVYTNGNAAICLNEKSVAYMLCARELGVISDDKTSTVKGNISAEIAKAKPSVGVDFGTTLKTLYAQEGKLAEARAAAIQTCLDVYKSYQ